MHLCSNKNVKKLPNYNVYRSLSQLRVYLEKSTFFLCLSNNNFHSHNWWQRWDLKNNCWSIYFRSITINICFGLLNFYMTFGFLSNISVIIQSKHFVIPNCNVTGLLVAFFLNFSFPLSIFQLPTHIIAFAQRQRYMIIYSFFVSRTFTSSGI